MYISKQKLISSLFTMIWVSFTYDLRLFICESLSSRSVILILFYGQFSYFDLLIDLTQQVSKRFF